MICWEHATWPRQVPKGWQDIGWEQATWPPGAQRMAGYRVRAGHLPKRHAQNTEGMAEDDRLSAGSRPPGRARCPKDGRISPESRPPGPPVLKGWQDIG